MTVGVAGRGYRLVGPVPRLQDTAVRTCSSTTSWVGSTTSSAKMTTARTMLAAAVLFGDSFRAKEVPPEALVRPTAAPARPLFSGRKPKHSDLKSDAHARTESRQGPLPP